MSAGNRTITDATASDSVVGWRTVRLRAAGLPAELAHTVAADRRYDLHALLDLLDRGCLGELAVRILAPLEEPPTPC